MRNAAWTWANRQEFLQFFSSSRKLPWVETHWHLLLIIYLTSSKHTPQINMSTFLDEADTSLDACRKQNISRSVDQSVMRLPCFTGLIVCKLLQIILDIWISFCYISCNNLGIVKDTREACALLSKKFPGCIFGWSLTEKSTY